MTLFARSREALDMITNTLDAELASFGPPDKEDFDRLRRFLLGCLIKDYNVPNVSADLAWEDQLHYLRLSQHIGYLHRCMENVSTDAEEREGLAQCFSQSIHNPARVLGIPSDIVVRMIHRSRLGKGCCEALLHNGGFDMLARKVLIDQEIVVSALVLATNANDRKRIATKLRHAIEGFKKQYFAALPAREYLYILNKQGMSYHTEQLKGTKLRRGILWVAAEHGAGQTLNWYWQRALAVIRLKGSGKNMKVKRLSTRQGRWLSATFNPPLWKEATCAQWWMSHR